MTKVVCTHPVFFDGLQTAAIIPGSTYFLDLRDHKFIKGKNLVAVYDVNKNLICHAEMVNFSQIRHR